MNMININFTNAQNFNSLLADIIAHASVDFSIVKKAYAVVDTHKGPLKLLYGICMPKYNNMVWVATNAQNKPVIIIERKEPITTNVYEVDTIDDLKLLNRLLNGFFHEMGYSFDQASVLVSTLMTIIDMNS